MQLTVNPSNGAKDFDIDERVTIISDVPVNENSISGEVINLTLAGSQQVQVSLSYDDAARTITVTPQQYLLPESSYTLVVLGHDNGLNNIYLQDDEGNPLSSTIVVTFTTSAQVGVPHDRVPAPTIETVYVPTLVAEHGLTVTATSPPTNAAHISSVDEIVLQFDEPLSDTFDDVYSQIISIIAEDIDGEADDIEVSFSTSVSDGLLYVTLSGALLPNKIYRVIVDRRIQSVYTTQMEKDYTLLFASQLSPYYSTERRVRQRISTFIANLPSLPVCLQIRENSQYIQDRISTGTLQKSEGKAYTFWYHRDWVTYRTQLQIISLALGETIAHSGISERLGEYQMYIDVREPEGLKRLYEEIEGELWLCTQEMPTLKMPYIVSGKSARQSEHTASQIRGGRTHNIRPHRRDWLGEYVVMTRRRT